MTYESYGTTPNEDDSKRRERAGRSRERERGREGERERGREGERENELQEWRS